MCAHAHAHTHTLPPSPHRRTDTQSLHFIAPQSAKSLNITVEDGATFKSANLWDVLFTSRTVVINKKRPSSRSDHYVCVLFINHMPLPRRNTQRPPYALFLEVAVPLPVSAHNTGLLRLDPRRQEDYFDFTNTAKRALGHLKASWLLWDYFEKKKKNTVLWVFHPHAGNFTSPHA